MNHTLYGINASHRLLTPLVPTKELDNLILGTKSWYEGTHGANYEVKDEKEAM